MITFRRVGIHANVGCAPKVHGLGTSWNLETIDVDDVHNLSTFSFGFLSGFSDVRSSKLGQVSLELWSVLKQQFLPQVGVPIYVEDASSGDDRLFHEWKLNKEARPSTLGETERDRWG